MAESLIRFRRFFQFYEAKLQSWAPNFLPRTDRVLYTSVNRIAVKVIRVRNLLSSCGPYRM